MNTMPHIQKPKSYLSLGSVDINPVLERLEKLSERVWEIGDQSKENKFSCFHHTQHIILRFPPGNRDPRDHYTTPAWHLWKDLLLPMMEGLAVHYNYSEVVFSKAMFARLKAGYAIDKHVDGAGSNLSTHKIHVPLVTNPRAVFYCNGEYRHLELGQAYEVNNIAEHAVENLGDEDRVHFVFELFDAAA